MQFLPRWSAASVRYIVPGAAIFMLVTAAVLANPGDQISPPGPILPANGCGANNGVGVAFDGTHILFTCTNEAAIRRTDTATTKSHRTTRGHQQYKYRPARERDAALGTAVRSRNRTILKRYSLDSGNRSG